MLTLAFACYLFARFARHTRWRLGLVVLMATLTIPLSWHPRASGQIAFDVNAMAPARAVEPYGLMSRLPGSRFVEVQLEASALFPSTTARYVQETMVRVVSRHEEVLVADYSPRTELQSDVFGAMQVSLDHERLSEAGVQGMAGYPGIGNASGFASQTESGHQTVHFAKKPAMELVTASGTIERHRGVYFKARQSSQVTLEGARQFRIVFEVPENWRADLLDVCMDAFGVDPNGSRRPNLLASQRFVVAIYQDQDDVAARAASNYIKQQSSLTQAARSYAHTIEHRNFPTPFHRLGAKLDIYEPEIPRGWFESLVYQPGVATPISKLSPLPVNLRVAVMNYLDQKLLIESLSGTNNTAAQLRIGMFDSGAGEDVARR